MRFSWHQENRNNSTCHIKQNWTFSRGQENVQHDLDFDKSAVGRQETEYFRRVLAPQFENIKLMLVQCVPAITERTEISLEVLCAFAPSQLRDGLNIGAANQLVLQISYLR